MLLLLLLSLGYVNAVTPPTAVPIFDYFCVNYTSNVITFTADVLDYQSQPLPKYPTQLFVLGMPHYPTISWPLDCTTINQTVSPPTTHISDYAIYENDINTYFDFIFPGQVQNIQTPLNPKGIAVAVQVINDTTTGFVSKLRFFFKFDVALVSQRCASIGTTFTQGPTTAEWTATIPIYSVTRSSDGTISASGGVITATRMSDDELVVAMTPQTTSYSFESYVDSAYTTTVGCANNQSREVVSYSLQYTNDLITNRIVTGPLAISDFSMPQMCYSYSVKSFQRSECDANRVCTANIAFQTHCAKGPHSNCTYPTLTDQLDFNAQAYGCSVSSTSIHNCTTPVKESLPDRVWSSINLDSTIEPVESAKVYQNVSVALSNYLPVDFNGIAEPTVRVVVVAVWIQSLELRNTYNLSINPTSLVLSSYDLNRNLITGLPMTYNELKKAGIIAFGVKSKRNTTGLLSCDAVLGCDSFGIDTQYLFNLAPNIDYVKINVTTTLPPQISNTPTTSTAAFYLDVDLLSNQFDNSHARYQVKVMYITLSAFAGGVVLIGIGLFVGNLPRGVSL